MAVVVGTKRDWDGDEDMGSAHKKIAGWSCESVEDEEEDEDVSDLINLLDGLGMKKCDTCSGYVKLGPDETTCELCVMKQTCDECGRHETMCECDLCEWCGMGPDDCTCLTNDCERCQSPAPSHKRFCKKCMTCAECEMEIEDYNIDDHGLCPDCFEEHARRTD
jgi:hypothetical protein